MTEKKVCPVVNMSYYITVADMENWRKTMQILERQDAMGFKVNDDICAYVYIYYTDRLKKPVPRTLEK